MEILISLKHRFLLGKTGLPRGQTPRKAPKAPKPKNDIPPFRSRVVSVFDTFMYIKMMSSAETAIGVTKKGPRRNPAHDLTGKTQCSVNPCCWSISFYTVWRHRRFEDADGRLEIGIGKGLKPPEPLSGTLFGEYIYIYEKSMKNT